MSALNGTFEVGDLVWRQLWTGDWEGPAPHRPVAERIVDGSVKPYGKRELVLITRVGPGSCHMVCEAEGDACLTTRYSFADPERPNSESGHSYSSDEWHVLEHAEVDGALF